MKTKEHLFWGVSLPGHPLHKLSVESNTVPHHQQPILRNRSQKIKDMLGEEKDFYIIVQSACDKEQIMDIKMMTDNK